MRNTLSCCRIHICHVVMSGVVLIVLSVALIVTHILWMNIIILLNSYFCLHWIIIPFSTRVQKPWKLPGFRVYAPWSIWRGCSTIAIWSRHARLSTNTMNASNISWNITKPGPNRLLHQAPRQYTTCGSSRQYTMWRSNHKFRCRRAIFRFVQNYDFPLFFWYSAYWSEFS